MKSKYTHVSALIDKSGSMFKLVSDTIGGFNNFLKEQKLVPGDMTLSLSLFDDNYQRVYEMMNIHEVKDLTTSNYVPNGSTALLDSLAKLINETGIKLAKMQEENRPEKVLFVIITDGEENASTEYTRAKIKNMIEHQTTKYNWEFIYLGANQDAFHEASSMGIRSFVNTVGTGTGFVAAFSNLSTSNTMYRSAPAGTMFSMDQASYNTTLDELTNPKNKNKTKDQQDKDNTTLSTVTDSTTTD